MWGGGLIAGFALVAGAAFVNARTDAPAAVIEIKEKLFLAQVNDVYLNPADYLGKTLKVAGIFARSNEEPDAPCFVFRHSPGCCGNDGMAGLVIRWDGAAAPPFPNENDWVEAIGILTEHSDADAPYLYLALTALKVLPERGAEFVSR
jgi:uncharacterized membrane protein YcgQ (UPF0703/DUF1980 family)